MRDRVCRGWQLTSQHFYDLPVINGNILSFFPPISFFPAFKSEMSCRGRRVLVTPRNTRGWKNILAKLRCLSYLSKTEAGIRHFKVYLSNRKRKNNVIKSRCRNGNSFSFRVSVNQKFKIIQRPLQGIYLKILKLLIFSADRPFLCLTKIFSGYNHFRNFIHLFLMHWFSS